MMLKNLILSIAVLLSASAGPLWATEEVDEVYDETRGSIDAVNLGKRTIVINDLVYDLALALKVHEGGRTHD